MPCCIVHGIHDDVVPPALSEAFVVRQRLREVPTKLVLVDDDHALTDTASLQRIAEEALHICTSDTLVRDFQEQAQTAPGSGPTLTAVPGMDLSRRK